LSDNLNNISLDIF